MKSRAWLALALMLGSAVLGWGSVARAADEVVRPAVIDFVSLGGIRDWKAEGYDAILIQATNGTWYRATFFVPCLGLRFHESVGFVTDGTDRLDKFSSVLVDGQRCWFKSFEKVDPAAPPRSAPEK